MTSDPFAKRSGAGKDPAPLFDNFPLGFVSVHAWVVFYLNFKNVCIKKKKLVPLYPFFL